MQKIKIKNFKRTAFLTTLAITSVSIQAIAQSFYPTFDYSATNSNIEVSATSQDN
ncbi:MAG: hypothetical protein AAGF83_21990 [Cyanobacteria bacterium P01_G01_bin.67]